MLSVILALVTALSAHHFILCCKDYSYVSNNTYIEAKADMIEYTSVERDWDGNGLVVYRKPKFFLPEARILSIITLPSKPALRAI